MDPMTADAGSAGSMPVDHFTALWRTEQDPWGLESSWYEDRKRAVVLACLPEPRYRRGWEPGCAAGALSVALAPRCAELVCTDVVEVPLDRARARLADHGHVRVERAAIPHDRPAGRFDLVVVSEVAYYLDDADRACFWRGVVDALEPDGTLLAVHWVREAPEYPTTGDTVHDELVALDGLGHVAAHQEGDFRLDVLTREPPPARSVAQRVGLR